MSKVVVTIEGETWADVVDEVIPSVSSDMLVTELTKRLSAQGQMLMIIEKDQSANVIAEPAAPAPAPAKKNGKAKAKPVEVKAAAAEEEFVDFPPTQEPETNAVIEGDDVKTDGDTSLTTADVRAALDAFRIKHGLVTARSIMVEVSGSSKLVDIPPTKYAELLAALQRHANPPKVAA